MRLKVDFYQLSRDPAEALVPRLAELTLNAGERLLVVTGDAAQAERLSQALWGHKPESFLAHGVAGEGHEARQPILVADSVAPANDARYLAFADGVWRDPPAECERAFLLFDKTTIDDARAVWRSLDGREGVSRNYWEQLGGKWEKRA